MNSSSIKIIFQDVDGCLNPADGEDFGVDSSWQPSQNQIDMLQEISRAVDDSPLEHFVVNTGRFWPILENLAQHLTTPKLRYFIMEHACVIYDRVEKRNLDLVEIARKYQLDSLADRFTHLETLRKLLAWYDETGLPEMERRYDCPMPRLDKIGNLSFAIPKHADGGEVLETIENLVSRDFSPDEFGKLEFLRSDRFIDILPGIDKMDGIELVLAMLDLEKKDAMAMGDYLNDLSVFERFDQVLCPANAHPDIIALTKTKGSSGIASPHSYGPALLDFLEPK
ncbi:HAD hydrolase family protein [Luteolibacter sp. AS25]|uniref:HAD hydrolase family protein n=1 Tax=Luteolibacter sp. AS25 TaxID=3135776 RepID=UPI00398B7467